jgi:hypothetical protein
MTMTQKRPVEITVTDRNGLFHDLYYADGIEITFQPDGSLVAKAPLATLVVAGGEWTAYKVVYARDETEPNV